MTASLDLSLCVQEPVDFRYKGFPPKHGPITVGTIGDQGWNALAGDLDLPLLLLKESALEHNLQLMARYCEENDLLLAPHGKTTMSPQLVDRQLQAGAWAVTVANVSQARLFRSFGANRILLANELVEPAGLRWAAAELSSDSGFELYCLADSVDGVRLMSATLAAFNPPRPLPVLLELGIRGGRTGCRTEAEAVAVAEAIAVTPQLHLVGLEGFEGILDGPTLEATLAEVDTFVDRFCATTLTLDQAGLFAAADQVLISLGGSAFFDRVVAGLTPRPAISRPVRLVLRSGCYVTHDSGHYEEFSPFGSRSSGWRLRPALEAWGRVHSRPEGGLAIVGFGKRDVPYDMGLPDPLVVRDRAGQIRSVKGTMSVTRLNDQHAYVELHDRATLEVGDLLGCGISHPCTAFDKWRLIPVVDDSYRVISGVLTYF